MERMYITCERTLFLLKLEYLCEQAYSTGVFEVIMYEKRLRNPMKRKYHPLKYMTHKVTLFLVLVFLMVGQLTPLQAEEVVRVAYFSLGSYFQKDANGVITSYDSAYLSKISSMSNYRFEYVDCKTWSQALTMLENHEVDLVGTAQWNESRSLTYDYLQEGYGYTVGEFATLPNNEMVYEDYEAIGQSTIGYTANYVRKSEVLSLLEERGISPTVKEYATQQELEDALLSGEIDIIVANSHTLDNDWNVVEKFSYSPYYFITWKGNTNLTIGLNDVCSRLSLQEPSFDDDLMNEYFPNLLGTPLTKEEMNFIENHPEIDLYYDGHSKPFAWYDEDTKEMTGLYVDLCDQINEITGLQIQVKYNENSTTSSNAQFIGLYYNSLEDLSSDPHVTHALIDIPFNFYYKVGSDALIKTEQKKIGFVNRVGMKEYLQEKYPNDALLVYNSQQECVAALEKGEVDAVFMNAYSAAAYLTAQAIEDVQKLPFAETNIGHAIQFSGEDALMYVSIINKAIVKIDSQKLNDQLVNYSFQTTPEINFHYLITHHATEFVAVIGLIILLIASIVLMEIRSRMMKRQQEKVRKMDEERADFYARMSHDMRTPINGVMGMLELSLKSNSPTEIKSNIKHAMSSSKYLLRLINDSLDLHRLEKGTLKLNTKVAYAKDELDSFIRMIQINAEEKKIHFITDGKNCDFDTYIHCDVLRVEEILSNLLTNAIKYTPDGGTVSFTIEKQEQKEDQVRVQFTISDTGIGMSPKFLQDKMFEPFAQENSSVLDATPGYGLGLSIVKKLVDLMDGKIEATSALGKGTTFVITLQFQIVPKETAQQQMEQDASEALFRILKNKKILVVEDQPLNAVIVQKLLEQAGCTIIIAQNGQEGLDAYKASKSWEYDAILMDLRMPVMDGYEATKKIRNLERIDARMVPIIAVSANAYENDIQRCYDVGMNSHVEKPIHPKEFYKVIATYILKNQVKYRLKESIEYDQKREN